MRHPPVADCTLLITRLFLFLAGEGDAGRGISLDRWHSFQDASFQTRCTAEQWSALCSVGGSAKRKKGKRRKKGKAKKGRAVQPPAAPSPVEEEGGKPDAPQTDALSRATFMSMFGQIPSRDLRIACRVAQRRMSSSSIVGDPVSSSPGWEELAGFAPRAALLRAPFASAADGGAEARSKLETIFSTFDQDGDGLLSAREFNTFLVAAGGIPDADNLESVSWCEQRVLAPSGAEAGVEGAASSERGITPLGLATFVGHYDMLDLLFEQEVLLAKVEEAAAAARRGAAPTLSAASKRSRIMEMVCRRCVDEVEAAVAAFRSARAAAALELDDADACVAQLAAWEKARAELEKYSGAMREYVAEDAELAARAAEFAPTLRACEAALALAVE